MKENFAKGNMLEVFQTPPDLRKYMGNVEQAKNILRSYGDDIFGGHITIGLHNIQTLPAIMESKPNLTSIKK